MMNNRKLTQTEVMEIINMLDDTRHATITLLVAREYLHQVAASRDLARTALASLQSLPEAMDPLQEQSLKDLIVKYDKDESEFIAKYDITL